MSQKSWKVFFFIGLGLLLIVYAIFGVFYTGEYFKHQAVSMVSLSSTGSSSTIPGLTPSHRWLREIYSGVPGPVSDDQLAGQAEEMERGYLYKDINNPLAKVYLEAVLGFLAQDEFLSHSSYDFRVKIYEDRWLLPGEHSTIAEALPNGLIYIGASMVLRSENEAQLAAVFAHEATHIVLRHWAYRMLYLKNGLRLLERLIQEKRIEEATGLNRLIEMIFFKDGGHYPWLTFENDLEADAGIKSILDRANYDSSSFVRALGPSLGNIRRLKLEEAEARVPSSGKLFIVFSEKEFKEMQNSLRFSK